MAAAIESIARPRASLAAVWRASDVAGATYGDKGEMFGNWWRERRSGVFCNLGCGGAVLGACVCEMRVLQQRWLGSRAAAASIPLRAGFWGWREARERFAAMACTSKVAALSADDFTVRRGATRPVAPWRASAIAAHFILQ